MVEVSFLCAENPHEYENPIKFIWIYGNFNWKFLENETSALLERKTMKIIAFIIQKLTTFPSSPTKKKNIINSPMTFKRSL